MATPDPTSLPVIAVTMGDPAGVGPEICASALLDPTVLAVCRPVLIGDLPRMRHAASLMNVRAPIREIQHPSESLGSPATIETIGVGELPADLPFGAVSPIAGHAAYTYIERAAAYANEGDVAAIATAPLNKAALHAGGHLFPGHTELLAHLTGVSEVSMMLSTPTLKVIHVTTHIGLLDAVHRIDPPLVQRTISRGIDALERAGITRPRVGVCGINPHAGENGLFGYGEEAEKIQPAIDELLALGHDVHGPLPADTAFFLATRGDFDLIVAMYHDQGHGPVKVLGIDDGVNITVGLPVIRTSVDHGTAFDIAGTGTVTTASMAEALRQAAALAGRAPHATV
ncbi:4-hydroxythreonine-4-phosphate dehydrogenase PdxA [Ruania zhangjianzhongii]|uniref:4-hydroxythreonine-4-phosphate dehydrogenase PdxA n=1 Tax=Ruania zhangjianzhongii TaxID=2603206 RepID=UPI001F27284F|nr:4-hydroxythreonine-4-phosphate dehydrogenase PdxA [Ruania zhangjianzhongii]